MSEIGYTIKSRREALGLKQEDLARMLGYKHKTSINKIEAGLADVPRAKLPAFARALGMSPVELSGWSEARREMSYSYCLEQQMQTLGWSVLNDTEGNVILSHDGKDYEITMHDVEQIEKRSKRYLAYLLALAADKKMEDDE